VGAKHERNEFVWPRRLDDHRGFVCAARLDQVGGVDDQPRFARLSARIVGGEPSWPRSRAKSRAATV
jgi:hypothetical protein